MTSGDITQARAHPKGDSRRAYFHNSYSANIKQDGDAALRSGYAVAVHLLTVSETGETALICPTSAEPQPAISLPGTWPVLSHGGSWAVVPQGPGQDGRPPRLLLVEARTGTDFAVPGSTIRPPALIAERLSHYVLLNPDTDDLAWVQPGRGTLELRAWHPGDDDALRVVAGAPIFAAWAPAPRSLAVHHGDTMSLFDIATGQLRPVSTAAGGFRTPGIAAGGQIIGWAEPAAGGVRLMAITASGERLTGPVVPGQVAFIGTPRLPRFLLAVSELADPASYTAILTWDPVAASLEGVVRRRFVAAFCSPGPERATALALAVPTYSSDGRVQIVIVDDSGRQRAALEPFVPSGDVRTLFTFFDQFGVSHSPWSESGRWLAFAGRLGGDGPHALFGPPGLDGLLAADLAADQPAWQRLASAAMGWVREPATGRP